MKAKKKSAQINTLQFLLTFQNTKQSKIGIEQNWTNCECWLAAPGVRFVDRPLRNEFIWKFAKNEKRKLYRTILIVYTHLQFTYTVAHPYENVNTNADTPRCRKSPREWFQRNLLWIHSWIAFHLWILFYTYLFLYFKHNKRWNFFLRQLSVKCLSLCTI